MLLEVAKIELSDCPQDFQDAFRGDSELSLCKASIEFHKAEAERERCDHYEDAGGLTEREEAARDRLNAARERLSAAQKRFYDIDRDRNLDVLVKVCKKYGVDYRVVYGKAFRKQIDRPYYPGR